MSPPTNMSRFATARQSSYGTLPVPSVFTKKRASFSLLAAIIVTGACLSILLCVATSPVSWSSSPPRMRLAAESVVPLTSAQLIQPRQIHLAYAGATPGTGMTVSWASYRRVNDSTLWVGTSPTDLTLATVAAETVSYYADDVYSLFTYHATLTGLTPRSKYFYRVGSASDASNVSPVYHFHTAREPRDDDDTSFEIAVYADFGERNAQDTVSLLLGLKERFDFIWHVGDISYADNAFHTLNADTAALGFVYEKAYNAWMDALGPAMSQVPYMTTVGNHEAECYSPICLYSPEKQAQLSNYSAYNARFRMPSGDSHGAANMWYSWSHGFVHFISVSSETDYDGAPTNNKGTKVRNGGFGDQLAWLQADLARVNRSETPWVILGSHRPIYGLKVYKPNGDPKTKHRALLNAFEPLLLKYKVDAVVSGHQHAYERHLPIAYNEPVVAGVSADKAVYESPRAPVYIVSGSCGSTGGHEPYVDVAAQTWNVMYDNVHFGISTLKVNKTALEWSFVHAADGAIIDRFVMTKQ
ncbi:hypothetical protein H257_17258 [Aphanomyces astaci]|uniref:Purple acid phosphatase n=1 Tax=Aphanomyces astaci TaxID=112090 RepID=W4FFI7_APHAT|nr:hypothetical protein H257_17258 [Aphanomyces astaci]ETV66210.1 hypothetical protein H257_17258 [Aphanomyces astaci]|eukprot:XP_009844279.1 hypothetical protein H257_17258 [Aphanomyces astaci]